MTFRRKCSAALLLLAWAFSLAPGFTALVPSGQAEDSPSTPAAFAVPGDPAGHLVALKPQFERATRAGAAPVLCLASADGCLRSLLPSRAGSLSLLREADGSPSLISLHCLLLI